MTSLEQVDCDLLIFYDHYLIEFGRNEICSLVCHGLTKDNFITVLEVASKLSDPVLKFGLIDFCRQHPGLFKQEPLLLDFIRNHSKMASEMLIQLLSGHVNYWSDQIP